MLRALLLLAFLCRWQGSHAAVSAGGGGGPASWPASWSTWPRATPSSGWPDGPIVGDGNTGLSVGGTDGSLTIYGTVHGFWSASYGSNSSMPPLRNGLDFPECPGPSCVITVGLTLLRLVVSSPQLAGGGAAGTWTAVLDMAAATATISLRGSGGAMLNASLWVSATGSAGVLTLTNAGSVTIDALNVTAAVNGNCQNVPLQASCSDASGAPAACASPPALADIVLTKAANPAGVVSPLAITAAAAVRGVATMGGAAAVSTTQHSATEPQSCWVRSANTATEGVTTVLSLPPGGAVVYALGMAASEDAGVKPRAPAAVATERAAGVTTAGLPALRAAHVAWWASYWNASAVSLGGEAETEAFWYASLYALGSGTRAGQATMDLWSPFRTTDYSSWRSNPTMDYNQQALYSGVVAANHLELTDPYYSLLEQAVASGSPALEAAALGCPGIHLSVDLAPYGLKLGVFGAPQAWGIRSNAAYAAVLYSYQWAAVDHADAAVLTWARTRAWPFLSAVADFWACYAKKTAVAGAPDGYRYWSIGDCDGDENCDASLSPAEATNPQWTLAYVRRCLETLESMAAATGLPLSPAWADLLAHLPPTATTVVDGAPVLAPYGEGAANASASAQRSFRGQAGYLHALWPGETLSPMSEPNATLAAAALNTFAHVSWGQDNSFSWVYASAVRAGVPPDTFLPIWRRELTANMKTNRLVAFGGLCSDSLGAVAFVHDMLVQSQEGFVRFFPAWPANQSASFTSLRMRGAVLVSATFAGRAAWAGLVAGRTGTPGVTAISLLAEGGGRITILTPWGNVYASGAVTINDVATGEQMFIEWSELPGAFGGPLATFNATRGATYIVVCSKSPDIPCAMAAEGDGA